MEAALSEGVAAFLTRLRERSMASWTTKLSFDLQLRDVCSLFDSTARYIAFIAAFYILLFFTVVGMST